HVMLLISKTTRCPPNDYYEVPLVKERRTYTRVGPAFPSIFQFSQGDSGCNIRAHLVAGGILHPKSLIKLLNLQVSTARFH
ncbi:MAG TPA: hypothetical protein VGJ08_12620, partial [Rhizomicrobium sp.]